MKKEIMKDCLEIVNVDLRKLSTLEALKCELSDDMQEKAKEVLRLFYQAEDSLRSFLVELNKENN